jgi:branched-chain amino acid transport system permease protein
MSRRPSGNFETSYAEDIAICHTGFQKVLMVLFLVGLLIVVPLVSSPYILSVFNIIGITIIAAIGLNILTGYAGQINLGQAGFIAVGAYACAILTTHVHMSFWLALPLAAIITGLVGTLFALPSLRVKGFYIAVTTLAAHMIIVWIITHGGKVTGGVEGLASGAPQIGDFIFSTEQHYYFLIIGLTVLLTYAAKNLVRTRFGRAIIAVRDNDLAAPFLGINVFRYKVMAFFMCAFYAGVAGALMSGYYKMITPEYFPMMDSIWYIGYLIVGGAGSIVGTIFGVIFLKVLSQLVMWGGPFLGAIVPIFSAGAVSGLMQFTFGVVIIIFLIFEPRGLWHRWQIALSSMRIWPFPY